MKTCDTAINYIWDVLDAAKGQITCPIYKITKPTNVTPDEFIVINTLPISTGVLQKVIANVNYHVKDIDVKNGLPDMATLQTKTASVVTLLDDTAASGCMVDFDTQEYFRESDINSHYSNLRFSVKIVNE